MTRLRMVLFASLILLVIGLLWLMARPYIWSKDNDVGPNPRPDVLSWINKRYANEPRVAAALTRVAESHQYILTHDESVLDGSVRLENALSCVHVATNHQYRVIDGLWEVEALAAQSYNSWTRARKRFAYQHRLSGYMLSLGRGVTDWERQCNTPFGHF